MVGTCETMHSVVLHPTALLLVGWEIVLRANEENSSKDKYYIKYCMYAYMSPTKASLLSDTQ